MAEIKCRNCGKELEGEVCQNCGYGLDNSKPFKNGITNREYKENLADTALSLLIEKNLINPSKDLRHLVVEFGYILIPENIDNICTLLKVTTPKRALHSSKVFYLGTQEGKMLLLNESFNDDMFRKISNDMLAMHRVDLKSVKTEDYIMELY